MKIIKIIKIDKIIQNPKNMFMILQNPIKKSQIKIYMIYTEI